MTSIFFKGYIKEYLCLVPHDRKFSFLETADVLHRSATHKEDFSGYRAASAWNSIGMYASNLLAQPWRKEYREMKVGTACHKSLALLLHMYGLNFVTNNHMFKKNIVLNFLFNDDVMMFEFMVTFDSFL
jgi:hypothetical protein